MKRLLCTILSLAMLLCCTAAAEGATLKVVNCREWVSLRVAADEDAARLAKVPLNAAVTDAEFSDNGFIRCCYGDTAGYILAEYLAPMDTHLTASAMQIVNCESWVSLRADADTDSPRLAKVPLGNTVTDCEFAGYGFVRCTYQDVVGYILAEYLDISTDDSIGMIDPIGDPQPEEAPGLQILDPAPAVGESIVSISSEDGDMGRQMQISGCDSWVSLRADARTNSNRRAKVPLGAVVTHCEEVGNGFIRCRYHGYEGYILADYVSALGSTRFSYSEMMAYGREVVSQPVGDCTFIARLAYDDLETLRIGMYDANRQPLWSCATACDEGMQLTPVDAFVAGTADHPMIALFNSAPSTPGLLYDVLCMLDVNDGHIIWARTAAQCGLSGGGICHAVDEAGNMYVGGYFSPDPVCISADGELLWTSSANDDEIFWLYEIRVTDGGIIALYESGMDGEMSGSNYWEVFYSIDPAAIAADPFVTPARVELKQN